MIKRNFREMLEKQWSKRNFVCVGLDTDTSKISGTIEKHLVGGGDKCGLQRVFNRHIVESTCDFACAYKPNMAFYEAHGPAGIEALHDTIEYIQQNAHDVPVILDVKRADVDNTNVGTLKMVFDYLQADAITVHPYLGADALSPFLQQTDKGIFVLCKTSNKGSDEFQNFEGNITLPKRYCFQGRNLRIATIFFKLFPFFTTKNVLIEIRTFFVVLFFFYNTLYLINNLINIKLGFN